MVMTILEAQVATEEWAKLEQVFSMSLDAIPPQISQSFLAQSSSDPNVWRIITIWRSREELDIYRQSVETPGGVQMFREVGAEPTLSVFDIREYV